MRTLKIGSAVAWVFLALACSSSDTGGGTPPVGSSGGSGGGSSCKSANFTCTTTAECCAGLVCPDIGKNTCCVPSGDALGDGQDQLYCCSNRADANRICEKCLGVGQNCDFMNNRCCAMTCNSSTGRCCIAPGMGHCTDDSQCCDTAKCKSDGYCGY